MQNDRENPPENPNAFPFPAEYGHPAACGGMTLRDWFAGQALPEVFRSVTAEWDDPLLRLSKPQGATAATWIPTTVANVCYQIADAMLLARTERTS